MCGCPLFNELKNAATFAAGLSNAFTKFKNGAGSDIPVGELAIFEHVNDELLFGNLADSSKPVGAPADAAVMAR